MKKLLLAAMLVCFAFVSNALDLRIVNSTASSIVVHKVVLTDVSCATYSVNVNTMIPGSGGFITVAHPGGAYASYDWGTLSITDGMYGCVCKPVNPAYVSCLGASVFGCGITAANWFTAGSYFVVQLA